MFAWCWGRHCGKELVDVSVKLGKAEDNIMLDL
jgi:hypothetical protein